MTRRTWGIAVRVLAVGAAIYTFFTLRSQMEQQKQMQPGAIQVKVVNQPPCGTVVVRKVPSGRPGVLVEITPMLTKALESPDSSVSVRDPVECAKLSTLHGSILQHNSTFLQIEFKKF